jgi:two-component system cell cycle sensor histidine kinase/response regulator CckA
MTLRERAERAVERSEPGSSVTRDASEYELHVHRIELQMQREELHRALSEVEEARARCFQLFDLAPIAYATLDQDGAITEVNFAAVTLLRMNRRELVGRRLSAFIDSSSADAYTLRLREVFAGHDMRQLELECGSPPVPVRLMFSAIRQTGPSVEISGVRLAMIDLTESREARAALVRERHHREALGALASGIAHDFNNLLMGVHGYASTALERLVVDSPVRPYLEELGRFVDGAAAILKKLRALQHGSGAEAIPDGPGRPSRRESQPEG